ncbi:MAG: leucine-rich repeat protein [Prevotella sp.]|nr:leucine-rich repeat protein [Prevotella sp.]
MKKLLLISVLTLFATGVMFGQTPTDYTVNLGSSSEDPSTKTSLADALTAAGVTDVSSVTSLTINGEMNDADIATLRTLTGMTTLDMTNVTLKEDLKTEGDIQVPNNPFITSESQRAKEYTFTTGLEIVADETHYMTCGIMNATELPAHMFDGMTNLQAITVPSSVTTFGNYCFKDCSALTTVNIPGTVTSLGAYTFYKCTAMTYFEIPASVTSLVGTFMDCSNLETVKIPLPTGLTEINAAFARCRKFNPANFVIPDNVTKIKEYAFYECTSLDNIVLPDNITEFDGYCFCGCKKLQGTVKLSNNLTIVGYEAFKDCEKLDFTGVEDTFLPSGLSLIANEAFLNCKKLTGAITYPAQTNNNNTISDFAFSGTGVTSVTIPEAAGITKIEKSAFEWANITGTLTIPSTVTFLGYGTFAHNPKMSTVTVTGGSTSRDLQIEAWCFYSNESLASVTFGENIANISTALNSFANNEKLEYVTLPASAVLSVGETSFADNPKLTRVDLGTGARVASIAKGGFKNCPLLPDAEVNKLISDLSTINEKVELNSEIFYNCRSLENLIIPANVTDIYKDAFGGNVSLKTIKVSRNPAPYVQTSEVVEGESQDITVFGATVPNDCQIIFESSAHYNIASYRANGEFMRLLTKTLDEDVTEVNWVNQDGADVILQRKMASKWNSVVLPFDCTQEQLVEAFGDGTLAAEFTSSDADKESFRFTVRDGLSNNRPVLLMPAATTSTKTDYTIENVNIVNAAVAPYGDGKYLFNGIYKKTESVVPENSYVSYQNHFVTFGNIRNHSQAFRAWLEPVASSTPAPRLAQAMAIEIAGDDGETTVIGSVQDFTDRQGDHAYYTLDGRRVENPTNGIYIVNGKKVVIK